jgi:hypothetical protein
VKNLNGWAAEDDVVRSFAGNPVFGLHGNGTILDIQITSPKLFDDMAPPRGVTQLLSNPSRLFR